jgi:hypothetical protein
MLRSIIPAVALALGLTACHPQGRPVAGAAPAPVAHHAVVAGESNRFFTARSEQAVAIAPDVRSTPVRDGGGHQKGFRLIAGDNRVATVTCECPASCSAAGYRPLSSGCWTLDDSSEQCWEACGVPDTSCASCGLVYWDGEAAGAGQRAAANSLDGIAIAEANERKEATR